MATDILIFSLRQNEGTLPTAAALPENNEASAELPLQMAERLLRAQPDSVANHVTDRSISDRRAFNVIGYWDWPSSK